MYGAVLKAIVFAIIPWAPVVESTAETVEISSVYDEDGVKAFDQLIWWDADGRVIAWRLLKRPFHWPDHGVVIFFDSALRRIRAKTTHRTHRQYDPEVIDRDELPPENRRELGSFP